MRTLEGSRALVTGGGGFIGANLVARLVDLGATVFCLVRQTTDLWRLEAILSKIELLDADLLDLAAVEGIVTALRPNYVFHAATVRGEQDWQTTLEINTSAVLNLAKASASPALRGFIHFGSSFEYGQVDAPCKESSYPSPTTFYGATRAAGTLLLQQYASAHRLPLTIFRIFHVYGPKEPAQRLVSAAIRAVETGQPLALTAPGFTHDFVYVDDVVDACCLAAERSSTGTAIFNIGSGIPSSNEKIASEISRIIGKPLQIASTEFPARSWDRRDWYADISRAREILGWSPSTTLASGLAKTIDWCRIHSNFQG